MKKPNLAKLERTIHSAFKKKTLLLEALTHPSFQPPGGLNTAEREKKMGFQRLEFLGDSVLNFFIAEKLFELFHEADEGLMSQLRSILVSRKLLARIARKIRLGSYLLLGTPLTRYPSRVREKILADSFEALIAAIYLDKGLAAAKKFLLGCFIPYFCQRKLFQVDPNPKSTLQEHVQKKHHILPVYESVQHKRDSFVTWVSVRGKMRTKGEGETKQEAETEAAAKLLRRLKVVRALIPSSLKPSGPKA